MKNLWPEKDAAGMSELDRLVYQSRLIGADPSLVLWGRREHLAEDDRKGLHGRGSVLF